MKKKKAVKQTTDEMIKGLFPKRVIDEAKEKAEQGSRKPRRDAEK